MAKGLNSNLPLEESAILLAGRFREVSETASFQDHIDAHLFALATLITNESETIEKLMGDRADRRQYMSDRLDSIIKELMGNKTFTNDLKREKIN